MSEVDILHAAREDVIFLQEAPYASLQAMHSLLLNLPYAYGL